jgi:hypothetical protein
VSKVEVRVGDGPWREAGLRDPLSGTTWVVWRVDVTMPYAEGGAASSSQAVSVRCYDGAGTLQAGELHTRRVQLTPSAH